MSRFIQFLLTASALLTGFSGNSAEESSAVLQTEKDQLRLKVMADFTENAGAQQKLSQTPVVYYTVPALSNYKRTALTYPEDGTPNGVLQAVAARGEFYPMSLVFYSFEDFDSVQIKISDLQGKSGTIPAERIDAAIVKVWVQ